MDDEIHPDPDAYVREGDVATIERFAIESICDNARRMATALYAVGAVGLLLWLWYVWETVDALTADGEGFAGGPSFTFSDGSPTIGDYITSLGSTWQILALAVLVGGAGALVQVVTVHIARVAGVAVGGLRVGDRLPGDDVDEDAIDD